MSINKSRNPLKLSLVLSKTTIKQTVDSENIFWHPNLSNCLVFVWIKQLVGILQKKEGDNCSGIEITMQIIFSRSSLYTSVRLFVMRDVCVCFSIITEEGLFVVETRSNQITKVDLTH